jgi:hypothetical protein
VELSKTPPRLSSYQQAALSPTSQLHLYRFEHFAMYVVFLHILHSPQILRCYDFLQR